MRFGFAPAKVSSLVVEDNRRDRFHIRDKLSDRVFDAVIYDNYRKYPLMEKARRADIVSLDFDVEETSYKSKYICRQLKGYNPHQSIIFFTDTPQKVKNQPINFVLSKSDEVWESYDRLLMSILVHDRSLALLHNVMEIPDSEPDQIEQKYEDLKENLPHFISSMLTIKDVVKKEDKQAARRYDDLTRMLKRMHRVRGDKTQILKTLHQAREPLMEVVRTELDELKKVDGVHTTTKLEDEIRELDRSIAEHPEPVVDPRSIRERVMVFAADKVVDTLRAVSEKLHREAAAGSTTRSESFEPDEQRSVYLNASFPEYEDKDALIVNVSAELLINLDFIRTVGQLGTSEELPRDILEVLNAAGYVNIAVISPSADIETVVRTLKLPPQPGDFAKFVVTPRKTDELKLTVFLLLRNDPVYQTDFTCSVSEDSSTNAVLPPTELAKNVEVRS